MTWASNNAMRHSAGDDHRAICSFALIVLAVLFLNACTHDLRRIDLSGPGTKSAQSVSYLLVDKGDYSADGQLLVEGIDNTKLNLLLDPAVYIVTSGNHTISVVFDDFRKTKRWDERLAVTMQPAQYYQVMPIRGGDEVRFELGEITKEKSESIGRREFKSMTNYLMRGER